MTKLKLKVGDQVTPSDPFFKNKVGGVIVYKQTNPDTIGVSEDKIWDVHWYNTLPMLKKTRNRYKTEELCRLKDLSVFKEERVDDNDE